MPVLLVGTQRSGSNMLRLMLSQASELIAPHPAHILKKFTPLLPAYGDLTVDSQFKQLIDDVIHLIELNPEPWEGVSLDRATIFERCRSRSIVAIFRAVYDEHVQQASAKDWVCKSLCNLDYFDAIEADMPDVKYVHLYRDGRDVAVSFRKAIIGPKHPYTIAQHWAREQRLAVKAANQVGPERFISVSYESLVGNSEPALRELCAFLGIEFCKSMLSFGSSAEAQRIANRSSLWSNVTQAIMSSNTKKYLKEMSETDIRIFESMAGDMLDAWGYERSATVSGETNLFSAAQIDEFMAVDEQLRQERVATVAPDDAGRRERQAEFVESIKHRQTVSV